MTFITCSMMTRVTPRRRISLITAIIASVSRGGSPAISSSRSRTCGFIASARPRSTFFLSVTFSTWTRSRRRPPSPRNSRMAPTSCPRSRRAPEADGEPKSAPTRTFSSTVMPRNACETWKLRAMPRRAIRWAGRLLMIRPWNRISPDEGGRLPLMRLISVVFPEPLGPITPSTSPRARWKSTSSSARTPPKDRLTDAPSSSMAIGGRSEAVRADVSQERPRRQPLRAQAHQPRGSDQDHGDDQQPEDRRVIPEQGAPRRERQQLDQDRPVERPEHGGDPADQHHHEALHGDGHVEHGPGLDVAEPVRVDPAGEAGEDGADDPHRDLVAHRGDAAARGPLLVEPDGTAPVPEPAPHHRDGRPEDREQETQHQEVDVRVRAPDVAGRDRQREPHPAARQSREVLDEPPRPLVHAEGGDGEVMAAQAKHGQAHDHRVARAHGGHGDEHGEADRFLVAGAEHQRRQVLGDAEHDASHHRARNGSEATEDDDHERLHRERVTEHGRERRGHREQRPDRPRDPGADPERQREDVLDLHPDELGGLLIEAGRPDRATEAGAV